MQPSTPTITTMRRVPDHARGFVAINDIFEVDRDWSKARHAKVVEDLRGRLQDFQEALSYNEWIDGGAFTVGDLMLISVLGGLRGSPQLDRFPTLAADVERGEARPAHRQATADQLAFYADPVPAIGSSR